MLLKFYPDMMLKSDLRGIEISIYRGLRSVVNGLKSDLRGIEMLSHGFEEITELRLKSDLRGIEIRLIILI